MIEGELGGVEFHFSGIAAVSIKGVINDGDAETFFVGRVDSQLVGAAGDRMKKDTGEPVFDSDLFPVGGSHFAVNFVVDLVGPVFDIESKGQGDGSFFAGQFPIEESEVALIGFTFLKLEG